MLSNRTIQAFRKALLLTSIIYGLFLTCLVDAAPGNKASHYPTEFELIPEKGRPSVRSFKIPKKFSHINFDVELTSPTSKTTVPKLVMKFKKKDPWDYDSSRLIVTDRDCTGEYHAYFQYPDKKRTNRYGEFSGAYPWPETINIQVKKLKKPKNSYAIYFNGEVIEIKNKTRNMLMELELDQGNAQFSNFFVQ